MTAQIQLDIFTNKPAVTYAEFKESPSIDWLYQNASKAYNSLEFVNDENLIKCWQAIHVSNYLFRYGIEPKGFNHKQHHHIMHQIGGSDLMEVIDKEMKLRKLDLINGIDIDFKLNSKR